MADMAPNWTPFRYGFNNPITVTDPTGMLESTGQDGGGDDPKKSVAQKEADKINASGTNAHAVVVDGKLVITYGGGGSSSTGGSSSSSGSSNSTSGTGSSSGGSTQKNEEKEEETPVESIHEGTTTTIKGSIDFSNMGNGCSNPCSGYTEQQIVDGVKSSYEKIVNPGTELFVGATEYKIGTLLDQGKPWRFPRTSFRRDGVIQIAQKVVRTPVGNVWVPTSTLKTLGKFFIKVGRVTGVVGLLGSGIQFVNAENNLDRAEAALDGMMGVIGFIPPVGWAISGSYFLLIKPTYKFLRSTINLIPKPSIGPIQDNTRVVPRFNLRK